MSRRRLVAPFVTALAIVAVPAPAQAATVTARAASAAGTVHTFSLPAWQADRVVRASIRGLDRTQRVAVRRVRRALQAGRVLRVRTRARTRRARLVVRLARRVKTTVRPETTITAGPTGTITSTSAVFSYTSNTSGVSFECRRDGGVWVSCPSPKTVSDLAVGERTFYVRAMNSSGIRDDTPATRTFTVAAAPAPAPAPESEPTPVTTTDPAPRTGTDELLRDGFDGPDGVITNEYAYYNGWDSSAMFSPTWEAENGTMYRRSGTMWTGVPNGGDVDRLSTTWNGSNMARYWTKRSDFGDVSVSMDLHHEGFTAGTSTWGAHSWDGIKLWLRRGGRTGSFALYTVEVSRRQGNVMIQKKCAGSDTYTILAQTASNANPSLVGQWERVEGSVRTNADGTVSLGLVRGGRTLLTAKDTGVGGCAPITAAGRVGFRSDNTQYSVDDFVVRPAA